MDNFAVFILTHGRPDNVRTFDTIRRQGYTGLVYIVIDDEDATAPRYGEIYGDSVITFSKSAIAATFDECDNFKISRQSVVYARNACFEIARQLGIKWFLELDDDYTTFTYQYDPELRPSFRPVESLDRLFSAVLAYYQSIPALTISFGQTGDLLGGARGHEMRRLYLKRKAMNTFFCCVDRPFKFIGRINEDVNMYVSLGNRGHFIFQFYNATIMTVRTQAQSGGMTEIYQDHGTYVKSFYTVMHMPSSVVVNVMRSRHVRLHHRIAWDHTVPVVIAEKYRKVNE